MRSSFFACFLYLILGEQLYANLESEVGERDTRKTLVSQYDADLSEIYPEKEQKEAFIAELLTIQQEKLILLFPYIDRFFAKENNDQSSFIIARLKAFPTETFLLFVENSGSLFTKNMMFSDMPDILATFATFSISELVTLINSAADLFKDSAEWNVRKSTIYKSLCGR